MKILIRPNKIFLIGLLLFIIVLSQFLIAVAENRKNVYSNINDSVSEQLNDTHLNVWNLVVSYKYEEISIE